MRLILDSSLSFKKHLKEKIIKAKRNLGIIKHLSIFLLQKTLYLMYKVFVRSHLDYCDCDKCVWSFTFAARVPLNIICGWFGLDFSQENKTLA